MKETSTTSLTNFKQVNMKKLIPSYSFSKERKVKSPGKYVTESSQLPLTSRCRETVYSFSRLPKVRTVVVLRRVRLRHE